MWYYILNNTIKTFGKESGKEKENCLEREREREREREQRMCKLPALSISIGLLLIP